MNGTNDIEQRHECSRSGTATVLEIALRSVEDRLGRDYSRSYGIHGCIRGVQSWDDGSVIVHLNSGGNALAVAAGLRNSGYQVFAGPPVEYGCTLVVVRRSGYPREIHQ